MSIIQTNQLTRYYGSRCGVEGVSLSVEAGEVFGFLGPNGAGKSTTIRLLLGFLKATSGSATIFGHDCWRNSAVIKANVGYVAGDVRLYPWLTARRAFEIVGKIRGQDLHAAGMELASRFELEVDLAVRKMSRGNRQKLALVMALVHRPLLLVLDEPTSGLDPLMQDRLLECISDLSQTGSTVFLSSHMLSEVEAICDRVAIVREGHIVADERLDAMKERAPRSAVITFAHEAAAKSAHVPEYLTLERVDKENLHVQLVGPAAELARWAAGESIVDISIGPPNLESLFRQHYVATNSAAAAVHRGEEPM